MLLCENGGASEEANLERLALFEGSSRVELVTNGSRGRRFDVGWMGKGGGPQRALHRFPAVRQ